MISGLTTQPETGRRFRAFRAQCPAGASHSAPTVTELHDRHLQCVCRSKPSINGCLHAIPSEPYDFNRIHGPMHTKVDTLTRGGERADLVLLNDTSECREDSRRTSSARASASVTHGADDTLFINVELYVHGDTTELPLPAWPGNPLD
jgi:hypothetical protein